MSAHSECKFYFFILLFLVKIKSKKQDKLKALLFMLLRTHRIWQALLMYDKLNYKSYWYNSIGNLKYPLYIL